MASDFTLGQLRGFIAVAQELNVHRAAARLHTTQPPLSRRVQAVESAIGAKLFNRTGGRLTLTPAGTYFLPEAERIIQMVERSTRMAKSIGGTNKTPLRVAYVEACGLDLLPKLLPRLEEELPMYEVELREMSSSESAQQLNSDGIDFAFLRPPVTAGIDLEILRVDPLVAVLPVEHHIDTQVISLSELEDEDFICFGEALGAGVHTATLQACAAAGFVPKIKQYVNNTPLLIGLIAQGAGVALIPHQYANRSQSGVKYAHFDPSDQVNTFVALARRTGDRDRLFHKLYEISRSVVTELDHTA